MPIIGNQYSTYADHARRMDPDGSIATIVNLLSQTNELLEDMLVLEGNLPTGHQTTVRTGLPQATWRLINQGIGDVKSETAQITDTAGSLECYSTIDKDLAELNGNTPAFRLSEDMAVLEGMNQQMSQAYIYSNALSTPAQIMGLAPRFSTLNLASAQTAKNVVDAGGTGSTNTSIWIVVWGKGTCHGFFPKGSQAGLQHKDLGEVTHMTAVGASSAQYQAYKSHYKWKTGLSVPDWQYVVRIANIDALLLTGNNAADIVEYIHRGLGLIKTLPAGQGSVQKTDASDGGQMSMGKTVIYCNRLIRTYLNIQASNKHNMQLSLSEYAGKIQTNFLGIPIRTVDSILNTEARVV
jgi:hypothetical protein